MISFLSVLNILAGLALLVYWIVAFIILYHLIRFGIGVQPKRFALVFFVGSIILSGIAFALFENINFNAVLSLLTK